MRSRPRHAVVASLLVGCLLIAAYLGVAQMDLAATIVYESASVLSVAAVFYGLRDPLRRGSAAWRALSIGITAWAVGDLLWSLNELGLALPWGHVPDAIYLASYVPLAWALLARVSDFLCKRVRAVGLRSGF